MDFDPVMAACRAAPEEVAGSARTPLGRFLAESYCACPPRRRWRLAESLGQVLRQMHDEGVRPRSWSTGFHLTDLGEWELPLSAPRDVSKPLGIRPRRADLVRGLRDLPFEVSRGDLMRFFRGYLGGLHDHVRRAFFLDVLRRLRRPAIFPLPARFSDPHGTAVRERQNGYRVIRDRSDSAARLAQMLIAGPEAAVAKGSRMPGGGRGCETHLVVFEKRRYIVKIFNRRRGIGGTRASRVWAVMSHLRSKGLPIPRPVLILFGRTGSVILVTEYADNYRPLRAVWPGADCSERQSLLVRAAILLGRLNRLGWIHGDFNWGNILVGPCGDLLIVDFDCAKRLFPMSDRFFRDGQHFLRDLVRARDGEEWTDFFFSSWRRWAGIRGDFR